MAVLRLVKRTNRDTVKLLEVMLELARRGEVCDLLTTYRRRGIEDVAFTGLYRERPAEAVRAAFRMSITLTQLERSTPRDS